MATTVFASIGDHGSLNASLSSALADTWIDRDLSWLDFNERVLAEALDERTPLLERAKFLAIFTSNLDEFFMKRQSVIRLGTSDAQRALVRQVREKLLPLLGMPGGMLSQSDSSPAGRARDLFAQLA
jgi:polyphosphate kinase